MKAASFIALGLSFAAAAFAGSAYYRIRTQRPGAAGGGDTASLEARIAHLEEKLADRVPIQRQAQPARTDEVDTLRKRVEALERQARAGAANPDGSRPIRPPSSTVEELKKRLSNTSLSFRERAQTIGVLRAQQANRTDDVIDACLALFAEAAQDQGTRAIIMRNLKGAQNARLVDPVIQILKNDPHEDVRDDAARLLAEYLAAKPEVRTALEEAAANDVSPKVKRSAQSILNAPPRTR